MIRTPNMRRNPGNQRGFTLIELLVVVVILGILSAVVVFAVRGTNDKGRANASAIDERTLRTAEETFCARFGRYGTEKQLAGIEPAPDGQKYKFISEESTYNDITIADTGGPCNGSKFTITGIPDIVPPPPASCAGLPVNWPKAEWCPAPFPAEPPNQFMGLGSQQGVSGKYGDQMVQLRSGKVLAQLHDDFITEAPPEPVALYDPTIGASGAWTPAPPVNLNIRVMVLIEGDFATCGQNCGKVLAGGWIITEDQPVGVDRIHEGWYLFSETGPQPGWTRVGIDQGNYSQVGVGLKTVQLKGQRCGADCGKVLVSSITYPNGPYPPSLRLFDPKENSFTALPHQGLESNLVISLLNDGEALIIGEKVTRLDPALDPLCHPSIYRYPAPCTGRQLTREPWAMIYRPGQTAASGTFRDTVATDTAWPEGGMAVGLPSGRVLVAGPAGSQIYNPETGGSWQTVTGCPGECYLVGSVTNSKVLALAVADEKRTCDALGFCSSARVPDRAAAVFDPVSASWIAVDSVDNAATVGAQEGSQYPRGGGAGLVLRSDLGSCGEHCGRALVAGNGSAEIYTPGP